MPDGTRARRLFRLRLSDYFWLQLLVVPVFLVPFYESQGQDAGAKRAEHWVVTFIAIFVAPTAYVAAFSYRAANCALTKTVGKKRSIVFAAISSGMIFGAVFGTLVFISSWVNWNWLGGREKFAADGLYWEFSDQDVATIGIFYIYLLSIGAAVGGLIGLAVDKFGRGQSPI